MDCSDARLHLIRSNTVKTRNSVERYWKFDVIFPDFPAHTSLPFIYTENRLIPVTIRRQRYDYGKDYGFKTGRGGPG